ncbi:hypothetical protein CDAR_529031 [Caerostris darwini]|uniref:Uncharacterized protein n=1 Tax=Caerostris darwini TaxID=1538125 RepID=A0AAV4UD87_9ARAC|nr:hypothetical protein CDAR_529031 [Caerostris darwini]
MDDALTSRLTEHRLSWSFPVTLTNSAVADDRLTIMMRSPSIITIAYLTDFIRFFSIPPGILYSIRRLALIGAGVRMKKIKNKNTFSESSIGSGG